MPRRCTVIAFPRSRCRAPSPDGVRLGYDFGRFCAELFAGTMFKTRVPCETLEAARAEVERLERQGLERLPSSSTAIAEGVRP